MAAKILGFDEATILIGDHFLESQNSEQFDANQSFLKIDTYLSPQSENTSLLEIDKDSNTSEKIVATNEAALFMITSLDSPPIGNDYPAQQQRFISQKSTAETGKAVKKDQSSKHGLLKNR